MTATLWDEILFQVRTNPHATAVVSGRGLTSYRKLAEDVDGLCTDFLGLKVDADTLVGIQMSGSYLHLLLVLVLDRLGVPSTSFAPSTSAAFQAELARDYGLTTVVSSEAAPANPPCRWIQMTNEEHPAIGKADPERLARLDSRGDCVVRILWSSGTTGVMKGMPYSRSLQRANSLICAHWPRGLNRSSRHLATLPLGNSYAYALALGVLTVGGCLVLPAPAPADMFGMANGIGVTTTGVLPSLLDALVELARDGGYRFETLTSLDVFGSHLPGKLVREARFHLTHNVFSLYGTTEAGGVAYGNTSLLLADPAAVGYLFPWIEAEVVDDADRPLPPGQEGILRLSGPAVVPGYYRDEAASQRSFRDGWFYTGDIATIGRDRLLRIVGRANDVINHDGQKVSAAVIEDHCRAVPGVRDVAVFSLRNGLGEQEFCAALVLAADTDPAAVEAAVRAALRGHAPARIARVDRILRNDNGKVQAAEMAALVQGQQA